jgi:glycosyltransferase involved in cell wall biosynthesis
MVEAMGHGLPIVAADTPVNREMCQGAALYYPPLDPTTGARAVMDALQGDAMVHLKAAGEARMTAFDWGWGRYAREFLDILDSVLSGALR